MKRAIGLTLTALLALAVGGGSARSAVMPTDDHRTALAAMADIEAARGQIIGIENDEVSVGHPTFVHAAQRALNAVVGRSDALYRSADGDPGDGIGAIGNIDSLLDRRDESLWTPAMRGAKANLLAVVVNLHDAMHEKQMEDYQGDLTEALANLALVTGRASEDGVLGGVSGALGNTSLAVPIGATTVSGCKAPVNAPAYGVVAGRLAFIALPRQAASPIPQEMSVSRVVVNGATVVLYTREATRVATLCGQARLNSAPPHRLRRTRMVRATGHAHDVRQVAVQTVAVTGSSVNPASYTKEQVAAGLAVFTANCQSCHGANLQGVAAPSVAGTDFLKSAQTNKWTLADWRSIVFENMPLNNPGTLTPEQYANVMAFLLASNCYPAGTTPFPQKDNPAFATVHIGPVSGAQPTDTAHGDCLVK